MPVEGAIPLSQTVIVKTASTLKLPSSWLAYKVSEAWLTTAKERESYFSLLDIIQQ